MRRFAFALALAALSAMLFAMPAFAVQSGDWKYSIRADQTLQVDAYLGSDTDVVIPAEMDGRSVSLIGGPVFASCPSVKSVTLPEGVTDIGYDAFADAANLESVSLPSTLTRIGMGAFKNCSALKSIVIPTGVTYIGSFAFEGCTTLSSIEIPETVTRADDDMLPSQTAVLYGHTEYLSKWASRLPNPTYCVLNESDFDFITHSSAVEIAKYKGTEANVAIPRTINGLPVYVIGEDAFEECKFLESVYCPAVEWVEDRAFKNCSSLKSVVLCDGMTSIGVEAFVGCSSLESISLSSTLKRIESSSFVGCTSLVSIDFPESLMSLGSEAFRGCAALKKVVIPKNVSAIPYGIFQDCSSLTSVTLPEGVTSLGDYVFQRCTSLKSIAIPSSVKSVGAESFSGCTSLKSVVIPDGVTSIMYHSFKGCTSLEYAVVPDSVQAIDEEGFPSTTVLRCSEGSAAARWAQANGLSVHCTTDADHEMREVEARVAPTCTAPGKEAVLGCDHCDYKVGGEPIAQLTHEWVEIESRAATCTEDGLTAGVQCSLCKNWQTEQVAIPAAHRWVAVEAVPAKVGFPGFSAGQQCSVCKSWLTKQTVIAAKNPPAKKITSLKKSGKKAFVVKWAKSNADNATGYQIRYSLKSSMKSAKTVKVKSWKTASKKIKKLKSGKKYFVQVRVYKVGKDAAGKTKTYCSKWSAKKSVKVA